MADGRENLILITERSEEEQKELRSKAGRASGRSRRNKRDLRNLMKAAMELPADPGVAAALSKTGIEVNDNLDVVAASILKGVMKGSPQMIEKLLELLDQDPKEKARVKQLKAEAKKTALEIKRLENEIEKQRLWLDAVKGVTQDEIPDDGFLEALKGSAAEDWTDEVL